MLLDGSEQRGLWRKIWLRRRKNLDYAGFRRQIKDSEFILKATKSQRRILNRK